MHFLTCLLTLFVDTGTLCSWLVANFTRCSAIHTHVFERRNLKPLLACKKKSETIDTMLFLLWVWRKEWLLLDCTVMC